MGRVDSGPFRRNPETDDGTSTFAALSPPEIDTTDSKNAIVPFQGVAINIS